MKLTDIIALVKAGYSAADIKELAALDVKDSEPAPAPTPAEEPAEQPLPVAEQPQPENEPVKEKEVLVRDKELEALKAKIIDLEKALAEAQKANNRRAQEDNAPTDASRFGDVMRNFM